MSAPADTLPGIMRVEMSDMDPGSLEDMVGTDCYQAALAYVQREAVLEQIWTAARNELWGLVQGSYGEFYTPLVCFSRQGQVLEVRDIQCSCHVSGGCEHATALLISAVEGAGASTPGRLAGSRPGSRPPAWDSSLESLLASRQEAGRPGQTELAIELTLVPDQPKPYEHPQPPTARPRVRLMARLMQPGKNGGWIGGSGSWGKLDGYGYGNYSGTQVGLLRELLALYRTHAHQAYYYARSDERSIELSAFESSRLWPLLDEAGEAGLQLVYGPKPGPVHRDQGPWPGLPRPGRSAAIGRSGRLAVPAGQAQQRGSGGAAGHDAGGSAARGARRGAGPVPRHVLSATAPDRHA